MRKQGMNRQTFPQNPRKRGKKSSPPHLPMGYCYMAYSSVSRKFVTKLCIQSLVGYCLCMCVSAKYAQKEMLRVWYWLQRKHSLCLFVCLFVVVVLSGINSFIYCGIRKRDALQVRLRQLSLEALPFIFPCK